MQIDCQFSLTTGSPFWRVNVSKMSSSISVSGNGKENRSKTDRLGFIAFFLERPFHAATHTVAECTKQKKLDVRSVRVVILGPFSRTLTGMYTYKYQQWYRQAAPYRAPLPYKLHIRNYIRGYGDNNGSASNMSYDHFTCSPTTYVEAYNKAYADFKDQVGKMASLAVNVAERKHAMDAMTKRVSQLLRFARSLRKFDFGEAASALGLQVITQTRTSVRVKRLEKTKKSSWDRAKLKTSNVASNASDPDSFTIGGIAKKRPRYRKEDDSWELHFKRRASAFGSNYLEFHFGWEPLMKDIAGMWDLFTDPLRDKLGLLVKGHGVAKNHIPIVDQPWNTFRSNITNSSGVRIQARVRIKDLDSYRLEQLGLLNPFVLAWELVPFSFIVDWFVNVGDYLASLTDFIGLELLDPMSTHFLLHDVYVYLKTTSPYGLGPGLYLSSTYHNTVIERTVGISGPTLALRPPKWPSVTRGLTAISLLTAFFGTVQSRR